jgi:hypothetical protein
MRMTKRSEQKIGLGWPPARICRVGRLAVAADRMKPLGAGAFDSAESMPIGCGSIRVRAVINGSWMKSSFGSTDNNAICIEQLTKMARSWISWCRHDAIRKRQPASFVGCSSDNVRHLGDSSLTSCEATVRRIKKRCRVPSMTRDSRRRRRLPESTLSPAGAAAGCGSSG